MGDLFWQFACIGIGIAWVVAGDHGAAASWLAASIVIGRLNKDDR